MRLAAIADCHGNSWALQAVLADIARRGVDAIVNLGDSADDAMDPGGTLHLLMDAEVPSIAGNYETYREGQLTADQIAWLADLPKTRDLGDVFCCHGTPRSDTDALIEDIADGRVSIAAPETILARLDDVTQSLVLCAHKHVPRTVWLPTGQLVVNPGSIGWPAYWNDEPCLHVMEAGSPHARYAVLEQRGQGWNVMHMAIPYDWEAAAAAATGPWRAERVRALLTGRAEIPAHRRAGARPTPTETPAGD